jgi:hypothetical protein
VSEDKSHAFAVWSAFRNPVFWAPLLGVVIAVIQFHVPVYVEKGPSHSGFGDRGTALFVTANSRESHVYGRWSEVAIFEVDSIPRDHRLVEQKAGRRTIPIDELIDRMLITALRLK